jgi:hypothetical protein
VNVQCAEYLVRSCLGKRKSGVPRKLPAFKKIGIWRDEVLRINSCGLQLVSCQPACPHERIESNAAVFELILK